MRIPMSFMSEQWKTAAIIFRKARKMQRKETDAPYFYLEKTGGLLIIPAYGKFRMIFTERILRQITLSVWKSPPAGSPKDMIRSSTQIYGIPSRWIRLMFRMKIPAELM